MRNLIKFYCFLCFFIKLKLKLYSINQEIINENNNFLTFGEKKEVTIPRIIWMFWEGEKPKLVEDCIQKVIDLHPEYEVNILDNSNIKKYCDIDFTKFTNLTSQQKSDLLRLDLLYNYGGYWLDASIILYESLDWIENLMLQNGSESFAFYRGMNTTIKEFPVLENWLLVSQKGSVFLKKWFNELEKALIMLPENYIDNIKKDNKDSDEIFQKIGNLQYLIAYVACQKIMRENTFNFTIINCDDNALFYQVKSKWIKQKILLIFATNVKNNQSPKLIKLPNKERNYLNKYYSRKCFLENTLLDFINK